MVYLIPMATIKRLLKMHNCTVLIIPKPLALQCGLEPGDYVDVFASEMGGSLCVTKIQLPEKPDEPHPGNRPKPH
jgi:hypothetical protein